MPTFSSKHLDHLAASTISGQAIETDVADDSQTISQPGRILHHLPMSPTRPGGSHRRSWPQPSSTRSAPPDK